MEVENNFAKFYTKDGYLYFIYKPDIYINLEGAKEIVRDRLRVQEGKPYRVICYVQGIRNMDKEARDYLATEGSRDTIAVGLIAESTAQKLMTNFYLAVSRPTVPTKMFSSEDEAKAYLDKFTTVSE